MSFINDSFINKKLFYKAGRIKMEQEKSEKEKIIQKAGTVFSWLTAAAYMVIIIYFVLKPLTKFLATIEYYIKFNIIKYFFN
jgi:hypothetical protein